MWNAISTTDFEQRVWNNQTGLELKYNTISAIFLILSLFLRLSFLLVSSRTAIMKGLFLLLPLSCDLNINTVPLSLVAQFIDVISLSEEPVRALAGPPPRAESKRNSAPSHQAVSSSTNWKAHCSAHCTTVPPSKVTLISRRMKK